MHLIARYKIVSTLTNTLTLQIPDYKINLARAPPHNVTNEFRAKTAEKPELPSGKRLLDDAVGKDNISHAAAQARERKRERARCVLTNDRRGAPANTRPLLARTGGKRGHQPIPSYFTSSPFPTCAYFCAKKAPLYALVYIDFSGARSLSRFSPFSFRTAWKINRAYREAQSAREALQLIRV